MKKFLVLCESSVPATEQMKAPPEQMKAGFEMWMKWMQKAGGAIVDGGAPLATPWKLFEGHPHFHAPGASIEVPEFIPMPAGQG